MALATAHAKQIQNTGANNKNKSDAPKNPLLLNGFPNIMKPLNLPNLVGAKRPAGPLGPNNLTKAPRNQS